MGIQPMMLSSLPSSPRATPTKPPMALICGCILAWFAASAVCTSASKRALIAFVPYRCGFFLTVSQFALSVSLALALCILFRQRILLEQRALVRAAAIATAYTAGFALLNLSLGKLHASFAETVGGKLGIVGADKGIELVASKAHLFVS